jgi:hypothetical protein
MSDTTGVLPDSRVRHVATPRGAINVGIDGWEVPVYCANCGKLCASCPAENMTFMFYLCTPCFETHGAIAGTMAVPDEVWWQKIHEESLETYGRDLSNDELVAIVAADTSPLATLIKEGPSPLAP